MRWASSSDEYVFAMELPDLLFVLFVAFSIALSLSVERHLKVN
jgi:hypothetical protein